MENFVFENATRFYFGRGQLEGALERELAGAQTVMIAYGGGSVKRTGLFDRIVGQLEGAGKRLVEFGGIMANPTLAKVMEGAAAARADRPRCNACFCVQDPELTFSVPESQKIAGGYDSLNHMMEIYFSGPVGDNLADDLLEAAMRSVIRNLPRALADVNDYEAHANLEWASSLAENRVLKNGKKTCFQLHMIEHQVGAYTDCVHGFGLAAVACAHYRCVFDASEDSLFQFGRFATNVWDIDAQGRSAEELALAGIDALDAWTREVGTYRSLTELGVRPEQIDEIAATVSCLPTGFKQLAIEDIAAILRESL